MASTSSMSVPSTTIMQQRDESIDEDDPFADLVVDDAPKLASPLEFGMGLKNVKQANQEEEDATEATQEASESSSNDVVQEEKAPDVSEGDDQNGGDKEPQQQDEKEK